MALQHAMALGMAGARYELVRGATLPRTGASPASCRIETRHWRGRVGAPPCWAAGLAVPEAHRRCFGALLGVMKKRAFRGESDLLEWRA